MQAQSVDRLVGEVLGNYRVERLLGHGRLNAVYLARSLGTQETGALTLFIIPERFSPEARNLYVQRFRKEAARLVALQHPHILPVYEYGEHAGYPYLVTPYMMNGSLADIVKQQGRCSHEYVLEILEQIAAGLDYAHSQGVIHGTLKPSNIVLSDDETMLVAGFGLMHMQQMRSIEQSDRPYAHLLSVADTFLAAPEYLAPEVVQGQPIDARSDIYALGIILFELLTGKVPFTGKNPLEVAQMQVQQSIPSLRTLCPDVPIGLVSVVNQALERDPARRFQRAGELAEAFAQVSMGATNAAMQAIRGGTSSSNGGRRNGSSASGSGGGWQLMPPIVTGKIPSVTPPSKNTPSSRTPRMGAGATGAWQLVPPIVTGQLPAIKAPATTIPFTTPSASSTSPRRTVPLNAQPMASQATSDYASVAAASPTPVTPLAAPAAPISPVPTAQPVRITPTPALAAGRASEATQPPEWWSHQMSDSAHLPASDRWELGTMQSQSAPARNTRPAKKRARPVNRRQVVALLAAGGVAAVGAAVVTNRNLVHLAQNVMHTPPTTATTGGGTASIASNKQPNTKTTGKTTATANKQPQKPTGHTGTVVGSSQMAANSAKDFTNPADGKASMLIHLPSGTFVAYEKACTHEGVTVYYDPATQRIVCPAHGAMFNPAKNGAVLQGPAMKPLPSVTVHVNTDGTVTTNA